MTTGLWKRCLDQLEEELPPQQFNTWIRPLQAIQDPQALRLLAPNRFVVDWVRQRFLARIGELVGQYVGGSLSVLVEVGSQEPAPAESAYRPVAWTFESGVHLRAPYRR